MNKPPWADRLIVLGFIVIVVTVSLNTWRTYRLEWKEEWPDPRCRADIMRNQKRLDAIMEALGIPTPETEDLGHAN